MSEEKAVCELCGEPMPAGEEMFKFHGYSGPCPKPPLGRTPVVSHPEGAALIAAERQRQISTEGWTAEHDDEHGAGELIQAAVAYADCNPVMRLRKQSFTRKERGHDYEIYSKPWPSRWEAYWYKPSDDPIRNLVKAGALIAAEIDRLQRAAKK